jgi:hypothetical protein
MSCFGVKILSSLSAATAIAALLPGCLSEERKEAAAAPSTLQERIEQAIREGARELVIPPGVYRVAGDGRRAIGIKGARGLTIKADGVKLVCTRYGMALEIEDCQNLAIEGLTIDYDPLPFTQGRVTNVGPGRAWLDVELDDGYPMLAESKMQFVMDGVTGGFKPDSIKVKGKLSPTGPRTLRVDLPESHRENAAAAGDKLVLGCNNSRNAIETSADCPGLTLSRVTVHSAPALGAYLKGGGEVVRNYNVVPGPAPEGATDPRLISVCQDALHFSQNRGGPLVEDCRFVRQCDDGINIHGEFALLVRAEGRRLTVIHWWANLTNAAPGNRLELIGGQDMRRGEAGKIEAVEALTGDTAALSREVDALLDANTHILPNYRKNPIRRFYAWTTDRDLQGRPGDFINLPDMTGAGAVIRRVTVLDNYNRGIVLSTRGATVEDCLLEGNSWGGIFLCSEVRWLQAEFCQDILLRNNVVRRPLYFASSPGRLCAAGISVGAEGLVEGHDGKLAQAPAPAGSQRRIRIIGNTVEDCTGPALMIASAEAVVVEGNRFIQPNQRAGFTTGANYGVRGDCAVWLDECRDVRFAGNTVSAQGPGGNTLVGRSSTAMDIQGLADGITVK